MRVRIFAAFVCVLAGLQAQKPSPSQWPVYQYNSDFSPLSQITPANVARLENAWTFHYGAGQQAPTFLGLDFRFEVQPLIIDGVMYISTPSSRDGRIKSTVSALEP